MTNDTHFDATGRGVSLYKKAASGAGTTADPYIEELALEAGTTVGLDAGANSVGTVGLDTGVNSIGTVGLDTGTNVIGGAQFVDDAGALYGVKQYDNSPLVIAYSKAWAISEGIYTNHAKVNKFGHNSDVPASPYELIWDYSAPYTYLADATFSLMYISSDAAGDQSLTYTVEGIDSDYNISSVTVTTDASNGRVFVPLTSGASDDKWWRIFRALNTSGTAAAGNIYISKDNTDATGNGIPDTTSDIQAQIKIGYEQTLMALWTCPTGYKAFMTGYYAGTSSNKVTEVAIFVRPFGGVFNIKHIILINQGAYDHHWDFPVSIAAKSDIKIVATSSAGGGEVSAGFDLWYEPV